jgi:hypothetical protein
MEQHITLVTMRLGKGLGMLLVLQRWFIVLVLRVPKLSEAPQRRQLSQAVIMTNPQVGIKIGNGCLPKD